MKLDRMIRFGGATVALALAASAGIAQAQLPQIVINEIVDDIRNADSTGAVDDREFIELYNAGNTAVNIGGWTLNYWMLGNTAGGGAYSPVNDVITAGTILQPGDYYVVGHSSVPNVDQGINLAELFPDTNTVYELRNGPQDTGTIVDAVGVETFRSQELDNARPEQLPQLGRGWWGQMLSPNANAPNQRVSLARYRDGHDSNNNGWDFGVLPLTPGASNELPLVEAYAVPNADAMAVGASITSQYSAFVLPRVIDPNVASSINPKQIPRSPQGGNAIVAWDESGGGDATFSKQYVNSFEISAYIETAAFGTTTAENLIDSESTIYGIGTTDPLFATPDASGTFGFGSSSNGSTGIGWGIERVETFNNGSPVTQTLVQLLNMKGGGESVPDIATTDWEVIEEIDVTESNWYTLGIDYDPTSGDVTARFGSQTFNFSTDADKVGTFYVGYRENLPGAGELIARPPTFDIALPPLAEDDADFDGDGDVDGRDFLTWQRNLGTNGTQMQGNANGTGPIDAADLAIWKQQFGAGGNFAAIPEPAGFGLALLAMAACWRCGKPSSQRQTA